MEKAPDQNAENLKAPEQNAELAELGQEQLHQIERQAEQAEKSAEKTVEKQAEQVEAARHEIERQPEDEPAPNTSEQAKTTRPVTKLDKDVSYKYTMQTLQRRMTPATRTFSKVIHNPTVDKISEVAGKTVLRPSVTVGATGAALLFGGSLYIAARFYGFTLSGSEFIMAMLIGGIFGLVVEGIYKSIRGLGRSLKR